MLLVFSSAAHSQEWVTEEVLKQLSEVRQELKALQDEVRGLKEQLNKAAPSNAANKKLASFKISDSPSIGSDKAKITFDMKKLGSGTLQQTVSLRHSLEHYSLDSREPLHTHSRQ